MKSMFAHLYWSSSALFDAGDIFDGRLVVGVRFCGSNDTDSFSGSELLRIARLAGKAYDRVGKLRAADREALDQPAGDA